MEVCLCMRISMSLNVFEIDEPVDAMISRCKKAGFDALDMNYWDHQPRMGQLSWDEEEQWAHAAAEAAQKYGIPFTQMHGPVHGHSFDKLVDGLELDGFVSLAKRSIQTAAILGIPWVVFHPSNISEHGLETTEANRAYNQKFYENLLPTMEQTGVGIALENLFNPGERTQSEKPRIYGTVPEELVELIDSFNHPLFGACWDTGHAHMQGLSQGESIRLVGSRLKALHIQDNNALTDQHLLPFHGNISWEDVMGALNAVHYQGDFTYEAHMSIRVLPDQLKDEGLAYAAKIGRYVTSIPLSPNTLG